jgi:hypothetical protein
MPVHVGLRSTPSGISLDVMAEAVPARPNVVTRIAPDNLTQSDGAGFVPAKAAHRSKFHLFRSDMNKKRRFACGAIAEIADAFND